MESRLRAREDASFAIPSGLLLNASFGSSPKIPNGADSWDGSLENMVGFAHGTSAVGVTDVGVIPRDPCHPPQGVVFSFRQWAQN